ncbi:MAG: AAA family ATPase [Deltaproteobacteria bacterium]|nr:AAA family ATPase [Deltaproteobacteria bacterium]
MPQSNPGSPSPTLYIFAGPNGAGKSTLANALLRVKTLGRFINADIIARGLDLSSSVGAEVAAGRIMLAAISDAIKAGESFGFESTLSGKIWAKYIREAKRQGYTVHLIFITVKDVEICLDRITERIKLGGHNVAQPTVRRRFKRCSELFVRLYKSMVDCWYVFDNSAKQAVPIAKKENNREILIDPVAYREIFGNE